MKRESDIYRFSGNDSKKKVKIELREALWRLSVEDFQIVQDCGTGVDH